MSGQTDHSEHANTLPLPELSPTLNPVLGKNMGRWAEVYFTSPPEKREEAVLELLRTLEAENSRESSHDDRQLVVDAVTVEKPAEFQIAADPPMLVDCPVCGGQNPQQRFCGTCGATLEAASESDSQIGEAPQTGSTPVAQQWESQLVVQEQPPEPPSRREIFASSQSLSDRHSSEHLGNLFLDSSDSPSSHRLHIGAVLTIIILAGAYFVWRGSQATSQGSHPVPQVPEVATQSSEPAPAQSAPKAAPPEQPVSAPASEGKMTGTAADADKIPAPVAASDKGARDVPPVSDSADGSAELATAMRYLNGTDGQPRDTTSAVDWLWKAVAKRNTPATLQLSDLFLKGNAVPQNCEQGRLLLDAAASRGSRDAAERLRHLQAFGCQ